MSFYRSQGDRHVLLYVSINVDPRNASSYWHHPYLITRLSSKSIMSWVYAKVADHVSKYNSGLRLSNLV